MERMLEGMVIFVAKIHNYILSLNDAYEKNFTDKQLHFLVRLHQLFQTAVAAGDIQLIQQFWHTDIANRFHLFARSIAQPLPEAPSSTT